MLAQYFNYGFDETTYKTYINQQVQKFYEQARITQALKERDDGDTAKHQSVVMYQQYLEQQAQRQVYKQIREDLRQQQSLMQ